MKLSEGNRMKLVLLKDFPMFDFFYTEEDLDKVMNFEPRPGDLFLVTYPKCGTTWMQYIIWEILHDGAKPPSVNQVMLRDFPFLEMTGPDVLDSLPPPRIFKTHMPYQYVPHSPQAKYVIVVRNPFDCCVSYFYHQRDMEGIEGITFDEYFDFFLRGELSYGNFFDHVLSLLPYKEQDNVLWVNFEDMKRDIRQVVFRVAQFLGDQHLTKLEKDPEMVKNVLKHIDFKYMREMVTFRFSTVKLQSREEYLKYGVLDQPDHEDFVDLSKQFIREGKVGSYKASLNEEQKKKLTEQMREKLKGTELESYWEDYI